MYVGIDISKHKHTFAIINGEGKVIKEAQDFDNSHDGFYLLLKALQSVGGHKNRIWSLAYSVLSTYRHDILLWVVCFVNVTELPQSEKLNG